VVDQYLTTKEDATQELSRGKQVMEQELALARVRVAEWEWQSSDVTATSVAYVVGVIGLLKSHIPDLDSGQLDKNFQCATKADYAAVVESTHNTASTFFPMCGFNIEPPSDDGQDTSGDPSSRDWEE
jgi:hypothetical protein